MVADGDATEQLKKTSDWQGVLDSLPGDVRLELGEDLGRLVNGQVDGGGLAVADLVEGVTPVGALAAQVHRVYLVLGAEVFGRGDAGVTLAGPLELGLRVARRTCHAGKDDLGVLDGDRRVGGDSRWSRLVAHPDLHLGARRVILPLASGRVDRVDGAARVVTRVLGGHAHQPQDRALDTELWSSWGKRRNC
jgi:hypothetical protein